MEEFNCYTLRLNKSNLRKFHLCVVIAQNYTVQAC